MGQSKESGDARPSVAAYFADLDEAAVPFLTALGQVVVAAAALEGNLRLELARLLFETQPRQEQNDDENLGEQIAKLEGLTAGQLLGRLRERGLPEDLERRISGVISRRNRLVHHLFEDPQLVGATTGTAASVEAIGRLERLSLECAALSVELQLFALPRIEVSIGAPKEALVDLILSLDPAQIANQTEREQVEAIQALCNAVGWPDDSESLSSGAPWGLNEHHRLK